MTGWLYNQKEGDGKKLKMARLDECKLRLYFNLLIGCKRFVAIWNCRSGIRKRNIWYIYKIEKSWK